MTLKKTAHSIHFSLRGSWAKRSLNVGVKSYPLSKIGNSKRHNLLDQKITVFFSPTNPGFQNSPVQFNDFCCNFKDAWWYPPLHNLCLFNQPELLGSKAIQNSLSPRTALGNSNYPPVNQYSNEKSSNVDGICQGKLLFSMANQFVRGYLESNMMFSGFAYRIRLGYHYFGYPTYTLESENSNH